MKNNIIRSFRANLRIFERLNQIANATCCAGITVAQCHVLLEIEQLKETTTKQLSKNLRLDKSTLSRTVDGLKKLGLIKRDAYGQDRRFTLLTLTKKGKDRCDSLNKYNDDMYIDIFNRIPRKERDNSIQSFESAVKAFSDYFRKSCSC